MCVVCTRKRNTVLLSAGLLPHVIATVRSYAKYEGTQIIVSDDLAGGISAHASDLAGVIVPSIDRDGIIRDLEGLAEQVHAAGALLVEYCDPSALGVLKTPAEWGADIAVGDGQPLGIPLNFGGPYVGFMACRKDYMRKLPGRIVGQTEDAAGRRCFVLTLQAREQHIRREKATSNICSNQSLMALWCTIYLSLMGPEGLRRVNGLCWERSHYLHDELLKTGLFDEVHEGEFLKEFVLKPHIPAERLMHALLDAGYFAALPTAEGNVSFCVTEKHGKDEIDGLVKTVRELAR